MSEKKYIITNPETFVIGVGDNKIPGGYIGRVLLTSDKSIVYETLDVTPQMCQQTCVIWCMAEAESDAKQSQVTPEVTP